MTSKLTLVVAISVVFACFVCWQSVRTWQEATAARTQHSLLTSDQLLLASIVEKRSDPSLFSRDWVLDDPEFLAHYTPSFIWLARLPMRMTGDWARALALLQGPLLVAFLAAAFAFFLSVTRSPLVAMLFALISTFPVSSMHDFWGTNGLWTILARTLALPWALVSVWLLLRGLRSASDWPERVSNWVGVGIALGIVANLHPTTGMTLSLVLGLTATAAWWRSGAPGIRQLTAMVLSTLVTSTPILFGVVGGIRSENTTVAASFEAFADLLDPIAHLLPLTDLPFFRLGYFTPAQQVAMALAWAVVSVGTWYMARRRTESPATLVFGIVQLGYAGLLSRDFSWVLLAVLSLYLVERWRKGRLRSELAYLEMMAAVVAVALVLPMAARPIWHETELWSLSLVVAELPRGGRLIVIPILALLARSIARLCRERSTGAWTTWLAGLTVWFCFAPNSFEVVILLLVLLGSRRLAARRPRVFRWWAGLLVCCSLLAGSRLWHSRLIDDRATLILAAVCGLLVAAIASATLRSLRGKRAVIVCAVVATTFAAATAREITAGPTTVPSPIVEAARWARHNTPSDALFYVDAPDKPVIRDSRAYDDVLAFRTYSGRSLTHCFKDVILLAYTRPVALVEQAALYRERRDAARSEESLERIVRQLAATHVVLAAGSPLLAHHSAVYANDGYRIVALPTYVEALPSRSTP